LRPRRSVHLRRGAPSTFAEAGLDFTRLEAVFITHLHVDHTLDFHSGARKSEANAEGFVGRRTGARCARYCLPSVVAAASQPLPAPCNQGMPNEWRLR
jgi:glyoxylase-like metal-dependent hydrolase (beta-lactamase superfamily II)